MMLWVMITISLVFRLYASTEKAVQIVSAVENQQVTEYHVNDDLNTLSFYPGPYKIISVVGQARKGKSTSLNSIISALINHDISPFNTSNNIDPCTLGIWMYVVPKCIVNKDTDKVCTDKVCTKSIDDDNNNNNNNKYCVVSDYSYIFLDIEGSDTAKNDIALRYAGIVTLLSSKVFLFIHESLYAHDIDHINNIETFRKAMISQNFHIPFDDIDLGIIIREQLGNLVKGKLEEKINELFQQYSGINLQNDSSLLLRKLPVFAIDNIENKKNYKQCTNTLANFIVKEQNYIKSTDKIKLELLSSEKIIEFVHHIINEMNNNENLNAVCIGCVFEKIVDWNEWSEWSECDRKCGGGIQERKRTCNTGRDRDCMKFRHGSAVYQRDCNEFDCDLLKWGEWSEWSECDKKCGGGIQEKKRTCNTGRDRDCMEFRNGSAVHQRDCNEFDCDLLKWGEWHPWSVCSEPCNGGETIRARECKTGNNKDCENEYGGKSTEKKECNSHSCYNVLCSLLDVFC